MTARDAAVKALLAVQEQGGYSNIVLDELLESELLSSKDRGLASRLLYGVIERRLTLDFLLNKTSSTPVKMMTPSVREILRIGVYQLVYMNKTPDFAVINEAVAQTRRFGCGRLSGFVNGVLRRVQREYEQLLFDLPSTDKGLEIAYSMPRAWIRAWRAAYGEETLTSLLKHVNDAPPLYIRINTNVTTPVDFCAQLDACNVGYRLIPGLPEALEITHASALRDLPPKCQSHYYFQDIASQWCCAALEAKPGEKIADMCAAPGGKTMTIAQYMQNTGSLIAGDIHEHKCRGLRDRVKQYGFTNISVKQWDASADPDETMIGAFDRVVCDVPCSGMGVIRRKPEIRYKSPEEFAELPQLQLKILQQGAKLVRPGGILHYSTCTLRPEENEKVVSAFLTENPDFSPKTLSISACFEMAGLPVSHQITLFPSTHGSDGFFIAGFVKRK